MHPQGNIVYEKLEFSGITAKVVMWTPEKATEMLDENNSHNRNFTRGNVDKVKLAIESGEWLVNGETIIVSSCGLLMDGQHRLKAVIETGISIPMLTCYGVDKNSFASINIGKVRSAKDAFSIASIADGGVTTSLIKKWQSYRDEALVKSPKFSNSKMIDIYLNDKELYDNAVAKGKEYVVTNNWFSVTSWALLYLAFSELDDLQYLEMVVRSQEFTPAQAKDFLGYLPAIMHELSKARSSNTVELQKLYAVFNQYNIEVNDIATLDKPTWTTLTNYSVTNPKRRPRPIIYPERLVA